MKTPLPIPVLVAVLLGFIAFNASFIIDQSEQGIIVQFGEPKGDVIKTPGLHWRVPFIQEVRRFDKRLLAWVEEIATLTEPDAIHWFDGSDAEADTLCRQLVDADHQRLRRNRPQLVAALGSRHDDRGAGRVREHLVAH